MVFKYRKLDCSFVNSVIINISLFLQNKLQINFQLHSNILTKN